VQGLAVFLLIRAPGRRGQQQRRRGQQWALCMPWYRRACSCPPTMSKPRVLPCPLLWKRLTSPCPFVRSTPQEAGPDPFMNRGVARNFGDNYRSFWDAAIREAAAQEALFDGRLPDRISNTATALSWCATSAVAAADAMGQRGFWVPASQQSAFAWQSLCPAQPGGPPSSCSHFDDAPPPRALCLRAAAPRCARSALWGR
jgi:hypothetical protein